MDSFAGENSMFNRLHITSVSDPRFRPVFHERPSRISQTCNNREIWVRCAGRFIYLLSKIVANEHTAEVFGQGTLQMALQPDAVRRYTDRWID